MHAEDDVKSLLNRELRLDKVAFSFLGVLMAFLLYQTWAGKERLGILELQLAEMRGTHTAMMTNIATLSNEGSRTAQRTEVLVKTLETNLLALADKMEKMQDWMNKGPRFTRDDGERLERRIEKLEESIKSGYQKH